MPTHVQSGLLMHRTLGTWGCGRGRQWGSVLLSPDGVGQGLARGQLRCGFCQTKPGPHVGPLCWVLRLSSKWWIPAPSRSSLNHKKGH